MRATSRSDGLPKYLKAQCPLSISIVSSDYVADVNHILVISTIDGGSENLSFGSATSCASLNHLDCNGGPDSSSQEIKIFSFSLHLQPLLK